MSYQIPKPGEMGSMTEPAHKPADFKDLLLGTVDKKDSGFLTAPKDLSSLQPLVHLLPRANLEEAFLDSLSEQRGISEAKYFINNYMPAQKEKDKNKLDSNMGMQEPNQADARAGEPGSYSDHSGSVMG